MSTTTRAVRAAIARDWRPLPKTSRSISARGQPTDLRDVQADGFGIRGSGLVGGRPHHGGSPRGPMRHLRLRGDVERVTPQYRPGVSDRSSPEEWSPVEQLRALVPPFALAVAILAAVTDWSSAADLILAAVAVGAFAMWAYVPNVPLAALSLAVLVPVVVAQRTG